MKTAKLKINDTAPGMRVPELLFGHFIEFMYDCIDPGMVVQLLLSRGFEGPDNNQDKIADPWFAIGKNDSHSYFIETEQVLAPHAAQGIWIHNHFDGWRGVAQGHIRLEQGLVYDAYVWVKAPKTGKVKIRIDYLGKLLYESPEYVAGDTWERFSCSFEVPETVDHAEFQIISLCEGVVLLDQASLMPRDQPAGIWEQVMTYIKELHPAIIRFPGGCYADCYHFKDGLGPADLRPATANLHWGGIEENHMGTDEYLAFCRYVGCEPLICVNFGTGTPEEAAQWVEYCNGSADTEMGKIRALNGHPEPYQVSYWDIGNENFAEWEVGHLSAAEYAGKYLLFYQAMKKIDPSIRIMCCGGNANYPDQSWNQEVLKRIGGQTDVLTLHMYLPMIENKPYDNMEMYYAIVGAGPQKCEEILALSAETLRQTLGEHSTVKLGLTEYNTSYHNTSLREQTLEAGLFNAGLLNVLLRHSDELLIANASDLVNGWPGGLIRSVKGRAYGTPSYHVIAAYAKAAPREILTCEYQSEYCQTVEIGNIPAMQQVPYLDIAAAKDAEGKVWVFAVNRYAEEEVHLEIEGIPRIAAESMVRQITITSESVSDTNTWRDEKIKPVSTVAEVSKLRLPAHSANVICLDW